MVRRTPMQRLARWHIWLGWVVGLPLLMWTATGLFMVLRPIEEVRGEHLRIAHKQEALPPGSEIALALPADKPVVSISSAMEAGQVVTRLETTDGSILRFGENGTALPPVGEIEARAVVARDIVGGTRTVSVTRFDKDHPPLDFRRPIAAWRVELADGTYVYVGEQSGRIEAVRTRWWRAFDVMWGLHILDPLEREDSSHPLLIGLAALSLIGALLGCILLFRRRRVAR